MQTIAYKTTDPDKFIFVEVQTLQSRTESKQDTLAKLAQLESELESIPDDPTDDILLEWARANYPMVDYSAQRNHIQEQINRDKDTLVTMDSALSVTVNK